jgi:hypothetical protein
MNNRAFAPEWISKDLGLQVDDFQDLISKLSIDLGDKKKGWVFKKCKDDLSLLEKIIEKKPLSIKIPGRF